MKALKITTIALLLGCLAVSQSAAAQISEVELKSIMTPEKVETSIGTLDFLDGASSAMTAAKVYDYLDRMRGVDSFFKGMQCMLRQIDPQKGGHNEYKEDNFESVYCGSHCDQLVYC